MPRAGLDHPVSILAGDGIQSGGVKQEELQSPARDRVDARLNVDVPRTEEVEHVHRPGEGVDIDPPPTTAVEMVRIRVVHRVVSPDIDIKSCPHVREQVADDHIFPELGTGQVAAWETVQTQRRVELKPHPSLDPIQLRHPPLTTRPPVAHIASMLPSWRATPGLPPKAVATQPCRPAVPSPCGSRRDASPITHA